MNKGKKRVLVAMSGGIDSSVAAARLVAAGYDVVGVTLHLWDYPSETPEKSRCCAPEDIHDARLVADHLGFPHYAFDRRELFNERVVQPFVDAYLNGNTPSPCVWCNQSVKMRQLFPIADRLGAEAVATGHYARIVFPQGPEALPELHRAKDDHKDQSYFLHMLTRKELRRVLLPLGDSTKGEVRAEAHAQKLPGADKGESQELCFVASGRYADFVEERADGRVRPGRIVNSSGQALGSHEGIHRFTVGQRRGLGVSLGQPAFVNRIDTDGTVVVDTKEHVMFRSATLVGPVFQEDIDFPLRANVKVRARHTPVPAHLQRQGDKLHVDFDEPVRAVSIGQVAVAYRGDRVLGGATIAEAQP
jgi:tRNA-uridine 2-sulfurtransferase